MNDTRYLGFQKACVSITERSISDFKTNGFIKGIVENVSYNYGILYLNNILKYNVNIDWDLIKTINNIGNPENFLYNINGSSHLLSPTTLRYLQFTLDMLTHISSQGLKNINVYEVGGGYGSQSLFLALLSPLFNITVLSYTIVDLKEINNLQKHYLNKAATVLNTDVTNNIKLIDPSILNSLQIEKKEENYFISNYALGELHKQWQDYYVSRLVSKCPHGYICWNFSVGNKKIHEYFTSVSTVITEENPQTNCPPVKSYNVTF